MEKERGRNRGRRMDRDRKRAGEKERERETNRAADQHINTGEQIYRNNILIEFILIGLYRAYQLRPDIRYMMISFGKSDNMIEISSS